MGNGLTIGSLATTLKYKLVGRRILKSKKTGISLLWKWIKFHSNYYRVHIFYFLALMFVGAGIITATEPNVKFEDALFVATSAVNVNGLMSLNVPTMTTSSQIVLNVWMFLGSSVLTSMAPVLIRRFFITSYVKRKMPPGLGGKPYKVLIGDSRLEYKALKKLSLVVFLYWGSFQFIGYILFIIYFSANTGAAEVATTQGFHPVWYSVFYVSQGFQNCGFGSLEPFQSDAFVLLALSVLIMAGNVAYPIFLRFIITIIHRFARKKAVWSYILEHPRRCFTHLFTRNQTLWLLATIIGLILVEMIAFLSLDWNLSVFEKLSVPARFLNAYFHAVSTRAVGWNSVSVTDAAPAMLIIWAVMMYISSYPVSLSVRASTVASIAEEDEEGSVYKTNETRFRSMWGNQAKSLLARDATLVFFCIFMISVAETEKLRTDKANFTIFHIIFECFSAYGTVGMSMGYIGNPASFSAVVSPFSKIILCILMLLGRHRGLPDSIDRAVQWNRKEINFQRYKKTVMSPQNSLKMTSINGSQVSHRSTRALLETGSPLLEHARRHNTPKFFSEKEVLSESDPVPDTHGDTAPNGNHTTNNRYVRKGVSIDLGEFEYIRGAQNSV